jgi:hypothetical protein
MSWAIGNRMADAIRAAVPDLRSRRSFAQWPTELAWRGPARRYVDAGGTKDIARSASAVMVSAGFTPGLAEMAEPSIT